MQWMPIKRPIFGTTSLRVLSGLPGGTLTRQVLVQEHILMDADVFGIIRLIPFLSKKIYLPKTTWLIQLEFISHEFNNVIFSGAKTSDVAEYQLYLEDQPSGQPSWQYYPRPSSGKPNVGTLTVGGYDIDFPGILNNCIIDRFPWVILQTIGLFL